MVRKTKQEAQETRESILDAAERLFHANGVSRTSLQDIAHAAEVTRGAIYWHFKDKAELFDAMMQRGTMPLEEGMSLHSPPAQPLSLAERDCLDALKAWRAEVAREHNLPAYVIFHDATLRAIAERQPRSLADLDGISGLGAKKRQAYGDEVLRVVQTTSGA